MEPFLVARQGFWGGTAGCLHSGIPLGGHISHPYGKVR